MTTANLSSAGRIILHHREASGRTAIHRTTWSLPCKWIYEHFQALRVSTKRTLDYGCGYGADVKVLREANVDAYGFDPVHQPDKTDLAGSFDYVLCTYVLNTLPTRAERMFVVQGVLAALKPGGHAFVSVRRDIKHQGWTSKGTYQTDVDLSLEMGTTMPEVRCTSAKKTSAFEIYLLTKADS